MSSVSPGTAETGIPLNLPASHGSHNVAFGSRLAPNKPLVFIVVFADRSQKHNFALNRYNVVVDGSDDIYLLPSVSSRSSSTFDMTSRDKRITSVIWDTAFHSDARVERERWEV
ncbi:hypothetical protein NECAME_01715 [Necator americanus]|uniref:Uncharacterized protein n=1 Tax=Necator americanus TaxID=51031 RepID=W2TSD4_NECAM|nr:hypothetical protein NECAME_01715 [Necator americanus]ETN83922.1 hypothetical protein NECAME_01715 [Necator americanus]